MTATIIVNNRTIVHKKSDGLVFSMPDVCLTKTGTAIVPVPYPNTAQSKDLKDGSKTVKVDGQPAGVKDSKFSRSNGDEAGTDKGISSHVIQGGAAFTNYSFDVLIEGKNAVRLGDTMSTNGDPNAAGMELQPNTVSVIPNQKEADKKNFVELQYLYADGTGVSGASFDVMDAKTEKTVATGVLNAKGYAYVNLPPETKEVKVSYYNNPKMVEVLKKPIPNPDKIPPNWFDGVMKGVQSTGTLFVGAIEGDFNESPTIEQMILNTAISMIPVVDQICDVRDLTANVKFLIFDKRFDDRDVWISLVMTVIGCIPEVGSMVKGIGKTVLKGVKGAARGELVKLIKVFNYYTKGHAIKCLRELSKDLPKHANDVKKTIEGVLKGFIEKMDEIIRKVDKACPAYKQALAVKEAAEKVVKSVGKTVDDIIKDLQNGLDSILKQTADVKKTGHVRTKITDKQVATKPKSFPPKETAAEKPKCPHCNRTQHDTGKYPRSKSERKKALLRDANDPKSDLDDEARKFIKDHQGENVPPGYEVSHEKPLYTKPKGERCQLDKESNMKTQPKAVHRKRHEKGGDLYELYPR